jgi:hypothetical protein
MGNEQENDDAFPSPGVPTAQPAPPISQEDSGPTHLASDGPLAATPALDRKKLSAEEATRLGAEGIARFEAVKQQVKDADPKMLNWAGKVARHVARKEERQMKAQEHDPSAGVDVAPSRDARKTRASKTKQRTANTAIAGDQARTAPNPPQRNSKRSTAADQENSDSINEQSTVAVKPKRSRRKATSTNTVEQRKNELLPIGATAAQSQNVPPITSDAIAFLSNPDAKASDLFKLAPDSQAFVQYHITNMQRLEANSALTHMYLLAAAPKYSSRFEKAVDALVSKLARDRPPIFEVSDRDPSETQLAAPPDGKANIYYGPRQASMQPQPAISVSLKRSGPQAADALPNEQLQENTIELGLPVEQTQGPAEASHQASKKGNDAARPGGQRLLRVMEAAFQATTNRLLRNGKNVRVDIAPSTSVSTKKPGPPPIDKSNIVPDEVTRRFLKVDRDYYFPDKTPAFSDRGNKLAMRGEHPEVVRSLVDIAAARGWENITVKGTESFRRAVWMEASQSGMKVVGYQPNDIDLADLSSRPASNVLEKGEAKFRSNLSPKTVQKAVVRAVDASEGAQATPGPHNSDVFSRVDPTLVAKAKAFEKDKPSSVVRIHPDLAPAYGVMDAAKKFAERNLPEDARDEFIGLARRNVMNNIISGEAVVGPKVYMEAPRQKQVIDRVQITAGKASKIDKAPRTKEIAREK